MSLIRLVIWSCLIGGWSAFFGWLFMELALGRWVADHAALAILMATLIAIPIGGGISVAAGLTTPQWNLLGKRLLIGLAAGLGGGLLGALLGSCVFAPFNYFNTLVFVGRTMGWAMIGVGIGAGIGVSEGWIDRSFQKLRNGLIGGVLGGFVGGLAFYPVSRIAGDMSSRALSFVMLGICVGLFIGLAQVILKQAWLTVEDGFRAGRQLILGQDVITMGTSEKSSLIFIAYGAKGVEPVHLKITKQPDGGYLLEDNQSRTGTLLNGQPVKAPTVLADGDTIQFGVNVVRFNEQVKHGHAAQRLPEAKPKPAIPAGAIQATAPAPKPSAASAIQPAKPASTPAIQPAKPAPKPAAAVKPVEGRCPICGKKIVGIPGERRCQACFTTF
jgi:pSer/pThr/pTyr-binding forkhead associated (FHA) protein